MFILPVPCICPACGHKQYMTLSEPGCPKCLAEFIKKNVPQMLPDPDGKPYDPNSHVINL